MKKLFGLGFILFLAATVGNAEEVKKKAEKNAYIQHNFVANSEKYEADIIEKDFINAWGIAIRPAGAGGHFWVTAKDVSYEYVGDVKNSANILNRNIYTDDLKYVKLPVGGDDKFSTGTVYNGSSTNFVVTQKIEGKEDVTAPAKFLFSSDGGIISAWTERKTVNATYERPLEAIEVINEANIGSQFFGLTINGAYNRLYVADFGKKPGIKVYGGDFKPLNIKFDMPFDHNKNGKIDAGEYAPFNIQSLITPSGDSRIFVAYAKTQACPKENIKLGDCKKGQIFPGEEDTSEDGYGRIAEFDDNGKLIAIWEDSKKLSAPWGLAFAPEDFGEFSNALLVSNFGSGKIAAFDSKTRQFLGYIQNEKSEEIIIKNIWGILFGNGTSLGDKNALYFAAGPDDEKDGLFGSLRLAE